MCEVRLTLSMNNNDENDNNATALVKFFLFTALWKFGTNELIMITKGVSKAISITFISFKSIAT